MEIEEHLEGAWDCNQCGHVNRGLDTDCANCSSPKEEDELDYLPVNARVLTSPEEVRLAKLGPHWTCDHCGSTTNLSDSPRCETCGQDHDEPDLSNEIEVSRDLSHFSRSSVAARVASARATGDSLAHEPLESSQPYRSPVNSHNIMIGVAVAIVVALFGFLLFSKFRTHEGNVVVTSLVWERQVSVEEYRTVREQDWSIPVGGREVRNFEDVFRYEDKFSHYADVSSTVTTVIKLPDKDGGTYDCSTVTKNGNGTFTKTKKTCNYPDIPQSTVSSWVEHEQVAVSVSAPVYKTKYVYDIERWVHSRWVADSKEAGGELGIKPYWPEVTDLSQNERVGSGRQQKYTVTYSYGDGKTETKELPEAIWSKLKQDQKVTAHFRSDGQLTGIDWPQ